MALALRGSVVSGAASSLSAPAGLAANDLVFELFYGLFAPTPTTGGITLIAGPATDGAGLNPRIGRKVAAGSETTFDATYSGSVGGILFAASGGDTATPYENHSQVDYSTLAATFVAPSVTSNVADAWHVVLFCDGNNSNTVSAPPAGYTLLAQVDAGGSFSMVAYAKAVGAGATGSASLTWGATAKGSAHSFVVRGAGGGANQALAGAAAAQASATGALSGNGTITIAAPLKNNAGTPLANETGVTVLIHQLSGALVATKSGLATNASGVLAPFTDPALAPGATYRCVIVLASGAEGLVKQAAA